MNKIALSVELPIGLLSLSDMLDQDFVIASYCLEYPEYRNFYTARRDEKEVFTYLDNGAFELGKSIDSREYMKLIDDIRPHVVVLPDVVNDASATVYESRKFLKSFKKDIPCYMGVLQGTSLSDYLYCLYFYLKMAEHYPIRVIGIPYHLFYRPTLLRKYGINDICKEHDTHIHILGLPNPFEIIPLHNFSQVVSVDSSLPVSAACNNQLLHKYEWIEGFRIDVAYAPHIENVYTYTQHNIDFLKQLCKKGIE